jgi:hypothetical protein
MLNQHGTILQSLALDGNQLRCCQMNLEWIEKWIDYMQQMTNTIDYVHLQQSMIDQKCSDDDDQKRSLIDAYQLRHRLCQAELINQDHTDNVASNNSNMDADRSTETIISLILMHLAVFCMTLLDYPTTLSLV